MALNPFPIQVLFARRYNLIGIYWLWWFSRFWAITSVKCYTVLSDHLIWYRFCWALLLDFFIFRVSNRHRSVFHIIGIWTFSACKIRSVFSCDLIVKIEDDTFGWWRLAVKRWHFLIFIFLKLPLDLKFNLTQLKTVFLRQLLRGVGWETVLVSLWLFESWCLLFHELVSEKLLSSSSL